MMEFLMKKLKKIIADIIAVHIRTKLPNFIVTDGFLFHYHLHFI